MAAISDADWGRIYAFIWREANKGNHFYKREFESNPKNAVELIKQELAKEGITLGYTKLFNIENPPTDIDEDQLEEIIAGRAVAFLQIRLTC